MEDSLYSYYTAEGIRSGLTYEGTDFVLNNKKFQIFSGSLHYFRLHPNAWEESIEKMRHCQLNTVCTYVPWNLHEDKPGVFDFNHILNLIKFIEQVKNQDMFLILRVGPYICAEIDFGGLPTWLLKDKHMKLRTNYVPYLNAVKKYFTKLISMIHQYQFSVSGGPIIAVQVENEYGSYGDTQTNSDDCKYMTYLKDLLTDLGIKELLFTCDMPSVSLLKGSIPDILMTANFQTEAGKELEILRKLQPHKPLMVAELWSGWFDHWGDRHEEVSVDIYIESLKVILSYNASFNIYVFQGGTNFGFSNGANIGFPLPESPYCNTVTSYDYGALLTESGDYTKKYFATLALLQSFKKEYQRPKMMINITPLYLNIKSIPVTRYLPFDKMLSLSEKYQLTNPVVMEEFGQRFGFTLYETNFSECGMLEFYATRGLRIIIFVNFAVTSVIEKSRGFHKIHINHTFPNKPSKLWILVENLGRINFTDKSDILNSERRGIIGPSLLNDTTLNDWTVYILDFNKNFIEDITKFKWEDIDKQTFQMCVGIYCANFSVVDVRDCFLYSLSWKKGIVIVNGFHIGRYWNIGPQQTLFIPGHILKTGSNEILAFELHNKITDFELKDNHIIDVNKECK